MINFFSTGQLARLLQIPSYKIGYAHSTGQLAEPNFRFLGKRCYDEFDVRRVAAFFDVPITDAALGTAEREAK